MVFVSYYDYMCNVCRSWTDVLHIMTYLLVVICALIVALYRFDKDLYVQYIYFPLFLSSIFGSNIILRWLRNMFFLVSPGIFRPIFWNITSNRLPYCSKAVKLIVKAFKNKFN